LPPSTAQCRPACSASCQPLFHSLQFPYGGIVWTQCGADLANWVQFARQNHWDRRNANPEAKVHGTRTKTTNPTQGDAGFKYQPRPTCRLHPSQRNHLRSHTATWARSSAQSRMLACPAACPCPRIATYPSLMRLADRGLLETSWDSDTPAGRRATCMADRRGPDAGDRPCRGASSTAGPGRCSTSSSSRPRHCQRSRD
jgi:hypothetical protein